MTGIRQNLTRVVYLTPLVPGEKRQGQVLSFACRFRLWTVDEDRSAVAGRSVALPDVDAEAKDKT
jgi:hypothetical protein